ncbi:hypothetical protein C9374_010320 [Naegleria lovaniensis]|uniref:Uncharacterized protein n=1 Tax=Naegleria lovaniensis TaxID=51637 RepID=A0AA88KGJ4_NAELO|nr:uncharacterized protein C9374_010320 [Naegleria lovaniensis]KAG2374946.1 hypothetical protein C9374_010320 [Naegleria lovaniensis]
MTRPKSVSVANSIFSLLVFLSLALYILFFHTSFVIATLSLHQEQQLKPQIPLILVPGYAASIISASDRNSGKLVKHLYESYPNSTQDFMYLSCKIINSNTMQSFVADDEQWDLTSPMDRSGLFAIDNLNPGSLQGNGPDRFYFHDMINYLKNSLGYEEGQTLFAFPYDWRQSITKTALGLASYVKTIASKTKSNKVNIISHSMGGYITKSSLVEDGSLSSYVNIYIAFGSPWQGTGKDWVVSSLFGNNLNNFKLNELVVRSVSLGSIAFYERMALSLKGNNGEGKISVNGVDVKDQTMIEAIDTFLKDNKVEYTSEMNGNVQSELVPFRADILSYKLENSVIRQIYNFQKDIYGSFQPRYFYNIFGEGRRTALSVSLTGTGIQLESDGSLTISNISQIKYSMGDYTSGDGVATFTSAMLDGLEATQRISSFNSHNGLLRDGDSFLAIKYYLEQHCHVIGKWDFTIFNVNGAAMTTETILIKETYDWFAYSETFSMNGRYFRDVWNGNMTFQQTLYDFSLKLDASQVRTLGNLCVFSKLSGTMTSRTSGTTFNISAVAIEQSLQCSQNQGCDVPNGVGVRECINGYLSDICRVTECNPGFLMSVGQPVRPSHCIENSVSFIAPIVIGSLLGLFILCAGTILCICFLRVKFSKKRAVDTSYQAF